MHSAVSVGIVKYLCRRAKQNMLFLIGELNCCSSNKNYSYKIHQDTDPYSRTDTRAA